MSDLSPSSYVDLAMRMLSDAGFAEEYRRRQGRHESVGGSCDDQCIKSTNCESLWFDAYKNAECNGNAIFDWKNNFMGSFRRAI